MRPIRLKMQAFGSYAKETEIDFTKTSQNLILITGDTGAGKSTIYDAITFALYHEASSESHTKEGIALQSQYATYDVEPYVEYTFAAYAGDGAPVYTVRRVPKHNRLKKKRDKTGRNYTGKNGSVTLTMPDGSVYAEKNVDQKIEQIVGLTKSQFMQIAMIAQGEFMDLLQAKTRDKKLIFRKLFGTDVFDRIAKELDQRTKQKGQALAVLKTECMNEVGHMNYMESVMQPEQYREVKRYHELLISGDMSILGEYLDALQAYCDALDAVRADALEQYENAAQKQKQAQDACSKAETLLNAYVQLDAAAADIKKYEIQQEQMQELDRETARLEAAYGLLPLFTARQRAQEIYTRTNEQCEHEKLNLPVYESAFLKADQETEAARQTYVDRNQEVEQILRLTKQTMDALKEMKRLSDRAEQVEESRNVLQERIMQDQEWLAFAEEKEAAYREQIQDNQDADVMVERYNNQMSGWDTLEQDRIAMVHVYEQYQKLQRAYDRDSSLLADLNAQCAACSRRYENMHSVMMKNQLASLATELVEGEACPLCGSREHPMPFHYEWEEHVPTQTELEAEKEKLDQLDAQRRQLEVSWMDKRSESNGKASDLRARMNEMAVKLDMQLEVESSAIEEFMPRFPQYVESVQTEILAAIQECRCRLDTEIGRKQAADAAKERLTQLLADREKHQAVLQDTQNDMQTEQVRLVELQTRIEEQKKLTAYADQDLAMKAEWEAKQKQQANDVWYNEMVSRRQQAQAVYERSKTLIEQYEAQLPALCRDLQETGKSYEMECNHYLEQKLFADEKDWLALTEKYTKDILYNWKKMLQQYKENCAMANTQYHTAKELIKDQTRPDMESLRKNLQGAELQYQQANLHYNEVLSAVRVDQQVYEKLVAQFKQRESVAKEYAVMNRLYRRVSGTQAEANKMDLETFVQRYYLNRILYDANQRFEQMTNGEYELRLKEIEDAGLQANEGLDLMVYSTVNGGLREIHTLSGGESFMAALALALGMADQIKLHSAAVHMDMMFIDEGFGSLDTQARGMAIRTLKAMAGSSRLIGIISHVDALKQEIEDQLVVTKDQQGSHVHWRNA